MSTPPVNIKARLKESYDAIAPAYNAWTTVHSSLRDSFLDKLLGYLLPQTGTPPKNRTFRVLELGCGAGNITEKLLSFDFEKVGYEGCSFHIVANDLSEGQLALGRERLGGSTGEDDELIGGGNQVKWVQSDMMTLSFPDESLDAVIGLYSLIHLPREEQEVMVGRIGRWLRRPVESSSGSGGGGVMLLNFGAEEMEGAEMEKWLGEEKGWMYWSGWGAEKMVDIVKGQNGRGGGLEVLYSEVVKEVEGVDASFLWMIGRRAA